MLSWLKSNRDVIQTIGSLVTIVIAVVGPILFWAFDVKGYMDDSRRSLIEISSKTDVVISELTSIDKYLRKYNDFDGTLVKVGINNDLLRNHVSVLKDNSFDFAFGDKFYLCNPNDGENYRPIIRMVVDQVVDGRDSKSEAEIFISKTAAERLGLTERLSRGIFQVYLSREI